MTELPDETFRGPVVQQGDFDRISQMVTAEFQVEESLLMHNVPTYYLKETQETKQAFLRLLKNLETINMIAVLRKMDKRIVLRVVPKPAVKPSNIYVNWMLFLLTVLTTFVAGYLISSSIMNPVIGGATFTVALLAVLSTHEMGHKLTANKKGIEATQPYFIPGPPPFGTFGAVIMQKSLPPNRDALFDVGADGPIAGFVIAMIISIFGLMLLVPVSRVPNASYLPVPLVWHILEQVLRGLNLMPTAGQNQDLAVHPLAFAGWVGIIVAMLNLLPAAMLDGGHVARSIAGEKLRLVLTGLSIVFLFLEGSGFWLMAILVLFMAAYKHPGPLDDVSSLSTGRKLAAVALVIIFVLCIFPPQVPTL
jgi:membrane-associated protease RseP (regulator of RpoE activity)